MGINSNHLMLFNILPPEQRNIYHGVTNASQLDFWVTKKAYCEGCCGGTNKWYAMFFVLIPTIKYYHLNDIRSTCLAINVEIS